MEEGSVQKLIRSKTFVVCALHAVPGYQHSDPVWFPRPSTTPGVVTLTKISVRHRCTPPICTVAMWLAAHDRASAGADNGKGVHLQWVVGLFERGRYPFCDGQREQNDFLPASNNEKDVRDQLIWVGSARRNWRGSNNSRSNDRRNRKFCNGTILSCNFLTHIQRMQQQ